MKKLYISVVVLASLLVPAKLAYCDTITLKDGTVMKDVTIVDKNKDGVSVKTGQGDLVNIPAYKLSNSMRKDIRINPHHSMDSF